jgi:hypothetical protein
MGGERERDRERERERKREKERELFQCLHIGSVLGNAFKTFAAFISDFYCCAG